MVAPSPERYGAVAQALHWLIALLIAAMFGLGWFMTSLPIGQQKFELYQLHKSLGITILALVLVRLAWRLVKGAPAWPPGMRPLERRAAGLAHAALYGLILAQPVIGFLQSNAANFPVVLWERWPLPALIGSNQPLAERLLGLHGLMAFVLLLLVALHVLAALRHHFWLKDGVLQRMLPRVGARP